VGRLVFPAIDSFWGLTMTGMQLNAMAPRGAGVPRQAATAVVLSLLLFAAAPAFSDEPAAADDAPFDLTAWLDAEFGRIWEQAGIDVPRCDDATFLRRIYLDLQGRIPSVTETREFLQSADDAKRARAVDQLIIDGESSAKNNELHAEHLARIWRRIMIPAGTANPQMGRQFEPWLEQQFRDNAPYDELARRLLTAQGDTATDAATYYAAVGGRPENYASEFTRVFLGARIGCAQCHDHPFTDWKQQDFWGVAAFFAGTALPEDQAFQGGALTEQHKTTITFEETEYAATYLRGAQAEIPKTKLPREVLARWMTSSETRDFAATAVNRVWQHLCGRGLVADVDNLDLATPEQRGEILDQLARKFADSGHDLRWLMSGICRSRVYQAPTVGPDEAEASPLAGRRPLKTLTPEQMFDSLEQALMLPVTRSNTESARHNGMRDQMVARLDESVSSSPEEYGAGIPQVLMLMNGRLTADATSLDRSRTLKAVIDAPFLDRSSKVDTLYLATFTRLPTEKEKTFMLDYVQQRPTAAEQRVAFSEIFWALLNSPEFVLSR
jgi:hypothetical protein